MIYFRDAAKLALTKLKIRKVRLTVSVVIASLLFALSVFVVVIVQGFITSTEKFNTEGLSGRYLVRADQTTSYYNNYTFSDPVIIAKIEQAQKDFIKQKVAKAKELGLEYDPKSEQPWLSSDQGAEKYLITNDPQAYKFVKTLSSSQYKTFNDFEKFAQANGAVNTFKLSNDFIVGMPGEEQPYLRVINNGQEPIETVGNSNYSPYDTTGYATLHNTKMRFADNELLAPFLLDGQNLELQSDAVPVFVQYSVAEQALGLQKLGGKATVDQKIDRIQDIRSGIAGKTIDVCYRNTTSANLLQAAVDQKADTGTEKPPIKYALPSEPCGDVVIVSDNRSSDQKLIDQKQSEFDKFFGEVPAQSNLQKFRIVGLVSGQSDFSDSSFADISRGLVSSSIGEGWIVPSGFAGNPAYSMFTDNPNSGTDHQFIAELGSLQKQKDFIDQKSCNIDNVGFGINEPQIVSPDYIKDNCQGEKFYTLSNFGNNAATIQEVKSGFYKFFKGALMVFAVLSSIIMMGVIGKIIADSRRETAVFRAIGATRLDISIIYGLYAGFIALLISLFATVLGYFVAILFSNHYSPQFSAQAILVFNSSDLSKTFSFVGLDIQKLALIWLVIALSALIGLTLALGSNLGRSPLKDMRDEN